MRNRLKSITVPHDINNKPKDPSTSKMKGKSIFTEKNKKKKTFLFNR